MRCSKLGPAACLQRSVLHPRSLEFYPSKNEKGKGGKGLLLHLFNIFKGLFYFLGGNCWVIHEGDLQALPMIYRLFASTSFR